MATDLSDIESVLKDILEALESIKDELSWYGSGFASHLRKELDNIESKLD